MSDHDNKSLQTDSKISRRLRKFEFLKSREEDYVGWSPNVRGRFTKCKGPMRDWMKYPNGLPNTSQLNGNPELECQLRRHYHFDSDGWLTEEPNIMGKTGCIGNMQEMPLTPLLCLIINNLTPVCVIIQMQKVIRVFDNRNFQIK